MDTSIPRSLLPRVVGILNYRPFVTGWKRYPMLYAHSAAMTTRTKMSIARFSAYFALFIFDADRAELKKWLAASLNKTISLQLSPPSDIRKLSVLSEPVTRQ